MSSPFRFNNSVSDNLISEMLERLHEIIILNESTNTRILSYNENVIEQYNNFVLALLNHSDGNLPNSRIHFNRNINNNNRSNFSFTTPNPRFSNSIPLNVPLRPSMNFTPTSANIGINTDFLNSLTPVPIVPTQEQINQATEIRVFSSITNPPNDTCPIVRERFQNNERITQILQCRHCFHTDALNRWFSTSVRCPVCRFDIRQYNPMNVIHNPYNNTESNNNESNNNESNNNESNNNESNNNETNILESNHLLPNRTPPNSLVNLLTQNFIQPISNSLNQNLIHTESTYDDNGNLNITYQFTSEPTILSFENDNNNYNNTTNSSN